MQVLQLLQRVGERGQSACRAFGGNAALRLVLQALPQQLDHGELVEHRTPQAGDKVSDSPLESSGCAGRTLSTSGPDCARRSRLSVSTRIRVADEPSRGGGTYRSQPLRLATTGTVPL